MFSQQLAQLLDTFKIISFSLTCFVGPHTQLHFSQYISHTQVKVLNTEHILLRRKSSNFI